MRVAKCNLIPQSKAFLERNMHTFISWLTRKFHCDVHLLDYTWTLLHPLTFDLKRCTFKKSAEQEWIKLARIKQGLSLWVSSGWKMPPPVSQGIQLNLLLASNILIFKPQLYCPKNYLFPRCAAWIQNHTTQRADYEIYAQSGVLCSQWMPQTHIKTELSKPCVTKLWARARW